MRCAEARRRLNRNDEYDSELIRHLSGCAVCSRIARAERLLNSALADAREREVSAATPFSDLRRDLIARLNEEERKEKSFMSLARKQMKKHPRSSLGVVLAVAVFAFLVLVPLPYNQIVGYEVSFKDADSGQGLPAEELEHTLTVLGYEQPPITVVTGGESGDHTTIFLPTEAAAKEVSFAFQSLTGKSVEIITRPVIRSVSASLYAQVRDKIKIEVESKDKTDEQIKSEIEEKLKAEGFSNPDVSVESKSDGMREVHIGIKDSSQAEEKEKEMRILLPSDETIRIKEPSVEISVDSEGKTDDEVRQEIERKLAEQGIENADIKVTKDSEGKRQIEVKIEKEENR
jgi:hypothetical protein